MVIIIIIFCIADLDADLFKMSNQYNEQQKHSASTVHFYSPKAYGYLRQHLKLPHPSTIRWYVLNVPKPAIYINCSLMLDGMSIRKRVEWDVTRKQMVGFVDLGAGPLEEEVGEALVAMAVGLQGRWKVPVGYVLIYGISAEVQRELTLTIIKSLYDINITVNCRRKHNLSLTNQTIPKQKRNWNKSSANLI